MLPDGSVREGSLDGNGLVRLDNIPCGMCTVRFPEGGGEPLELIGVRAPEDKDWIEIVLEDHDGTPVANERYRIRLPDGDTRQGQLDANGFARVDEIPSGLCQVSFPERDAAEVKGPL